MADNGNGTRYYSRAFVASVLAVLTVTFSAFFTLYNHIRGEIDGAVSVSRQELTTAIVGLERQIDSLEKAIQTAGVHTMDRISVVDTRLSSRITAAENRAFDLAIAKSLGSADVDKAGGE